MDDQPQRGGIAVVLLSYNRPKMLELAYDSIKGEDSIILVDDGSDVFDAAEWAREHHGITSTVQGVRRSVDQRMTQASLGRLINGALHIAYHVLKMGYIAYLCDDDLFVPGWPKTARECLEAHPEAHVVRGSWRSFDDPLTDGQPMARPRKSRPAPLDVRRMTTGNFAHRAECYVEGLRWSEETVAVHDDTFLWRLLQLHPMETILDAKTLAGYRREHAFNGAHFTSHTQYAVGAYEWLNRGALE
jgi:glycosyltransferase involved in cell wall biosynthesis